MSRLFFVRASMLGMLLIGFYMITPRLKHFKPSEFGIWWPLMDRDLLLKLDKFREAWGAPVVISRAPGGIGRHGGKSGGSQHNIDTWGRVRAIDIFPQIVTNDGRRGIATSEERERAYRIADAVGFTGIGLYTDTKPSNMLHVDVRRDREAGDPATWSRVAGDYLGIDEVLV